MNVFVAGATGYVGGGIVRELVRAGHDVVALSRTREAGEALRALGAATVRGELREPATYEAAAAQADAIIHAGFDYENPVETDATAVSAFLRAARTVGEAREELAVSFIYTSGLWVLGDTGDEPAAEDAPTDHPAEIVTWRVSHERRVLAAAGGGLSTAVIRPGMIYGGAGGVVRTMFETAEETGAAEYIGDGENHWSMVHVEDVAPLYRLVLEERASGVFHAVDEAPLRVAEVAAAASHAAGAEGATRSLPLAEARATLGPTADAMCLDQRLAAPRAHALGWEPEHGPFTEEAGGAYEEWKAATAEWVPS